jgi:hypothetical protein
MNNRDIVRSSEAKVDGITDLWEGGEDFVRIFKILIVNGTEIKQNGKGKIRRKRTC